MKGFAEHLYQEELYDFSIPLLVVLPEPWHKILDSEKALLAKILASVKMHPDAATIIATQSASLETLLAHRPRKVLIFGNVLANQIRAYETITANDTQVLRADGLGELDDAKKKSLWVALRQMFGL